MRFSPRSFNPAGAHPGPVARILPGPAAYTDRAVYGVARDPFDAEVVVRIDLVPARTDP